MIDSKKEKKREKKIRKQGMRKKMTQRQIAHRWACDAVMRQGQASMQEGREDIIAERGSRESHWGRAKRGGHFRSNESRAGE